MGEIMQQAELDALVMTAQEGNEKAFCLLVKHLHPGLLRFSLQICKDKQLANDAVQEVWLQCSRTLRSLQDPRALKSWLHQGVRWRTLDLLRKQLPEKHYDSFAEEQFVPDDTCESDSSDLRKEMQLLPDVDRQALHLFYLEDLSIKEISAVLGIPLGTVKSRLNRARNSLKEKLE
jgi:RNA polymerase sigma-70 factor, ECF subfamily